MHTDAGIVGLGEPVLEGHCTSVEAVLREFEEYLIGKDPMLIEHHLQALYRGGFYRGGPLMLSAISAIAYILSLIPLKYFPASEVSVFNLLITVFGVVMSGIVLGESIFRLNYLIALVLIALGILAVNRKQGNGA